LASSGAVVTQESIDVGGETRRYLLVVPPSPPTAVVLSLHGTRSMADRQLRLSRLDTVGIRAGVASAFPEAIDPIGRGYEWNPAVDVAYLSRLVHALIERFPSAGGQVCMTGMSGGARMSCYFAARHSAVVSLVGAVAGLRAPGATPLAQAVPILAFHGTSDRINPYDGSGTPRWNESVPEAARQWAAANGADPQPTALQVSRHVSRSIYGRVGAGNEVMLWTVSGGGHTWPGSPLGLLLRVLLGKTTTEIDATQILLSYPQV
jgi:polyhydroxybutyrate depolymerase